MVDEAGPTKPNPSLVAVLQNLCGARNPLTAVRGFLSNTWLKIQRRDNCCGNYGDPGC